ncbi:hypothetical protein [Tessaracoccus sp. ZS01]|nr:hypothetical protein [Tessaracoccus sp. ZS01]
MAYATRVIEVAKDAPAFPGENTRRVDATPALALGVEVVFGRDE